LCALGSGHHRPSSVGPPPARLAPPPGCTFARPPSRGGRRRVRFDERRAAALRRWKAEQSEERLAFGGAWKRDGGLGIEAPWIVTEPDGTVIHPDTLLARWGRLVEAAGVPRIPLHGARHSYAMVALGAGVCLDVVSRQLGHANIATTGNIYTHDSDEAGNEAAERVAAAFLAKPRSESS